MFERYTEKARRVIFFARYEASHYGSPYIETEHMLLGSLREDKQILAFLKPGSGEQIRQEIDARTIDKHAICTSVDLPLSNECKRVLAYAAEEAERLGHRHIGSEHLILGLLRERDCFAAELLQQHGLELEKFRDEARKPPKFATSAAGSDSVLGRRHVPLQAPIKIHGARWNVDHVRSKVESHHEYSWHWHKQEWKPRDIVIHRTSALVSFDLDLAKEPTSFELVKGGWQKDHCAICRWELMASSDPEHSTGYTNGRDWLCCECYEKFFARPDFFKSNYPEMT